MFWNQWSQENAKRRTNWKKFFFDLLPSPFNGYTLFKLFILGFISEIKCKETVKDQGYSQLCQDMSRHGQVMPLVLVSQDLARYSKIRPKYCKSYQDMVKLPCHVMTRYSKICPNMPGYVKNSQGMPCYTNVRLDIANQWPDMEKICPAVIHS